MAQIDYPPGLPLPQREGYALRHQSPTVEAEAITGRSVSRRRFRNGPSFASVSWTFSEAEAQLFEVWFKAEKDQLGIADGTIWFNCPLQTPVGIKHYEAKFKGIYEDPELFGINYWRISATLELRERQTIDPIELQYPQEVLYSSLFDTNMNRDWSKP